MGCILSTTKDGRVIIPSKHFPRYVAGLPAMTGKVVVITGCTTGVGYILAKSCVKLGAKVVMVNRASERADVAFDDIKNLASEFQAPAPLLIPCDLMRFKSVREAGAQINSALASEGIDVLVNNAGIMGFGDIATEDGCDIQMQTNHTSHFLLTYLCMPLLEKAASLRGEARIVNHSSAARKMDAPMENKFDPKYVDKNGGNLGGNSTTFFKGANFQRYQQTKLANVIFTYALDEKLKAKGSKVKALVAHPGVAPTNLAPGTAKAGGMDDMKGIPACIGNFIFYLIMQSEEDGALGILRCTCDPDVKSREFYGPRGKKEDALTHDQSEYCGMAELKSEEQLADKDAQVALWAVSEKVTGIQFAI